MSKLMKKQHQANRKPAPGMEQRSIYQVSIQRGKARSRVRYVETSQTGSGCKCL